MEKKLKIVLVASLAANLFLAGVVAGKLGNCHGGHDRGRSDFPRNESVREFMAAHNKDRREINLAKAEALRLLDGETPDRAAFEARVDEVSAMQTKLFKQFMNDTADRMLKLPADKRAEKIEKLIKRTEKAPAERQPRIKKEGKSGEPRAHRSGRKPAAE